MSRCLKSELSAIAINKTSPSAELPPVIHLCDQKFAKMPHPMSPSLWIIIVYILLVFTSPVVEHSSDMQTTVILLFLAANLLMGVSSNILLWLLQDMYTIVPHHLIGRYKALGLIFSTERKSSATLRHQAWLLPLSLVLFALPLSFATAFTFTKSMKVTGSIASDPAAVAGLLSKLGISLRYRDISSSTSSADLSSTSSNFLW